MSLARVINALPRIELRGLMAIPTATDDIAIQRREFAQMKVLFDQLRNVYPSVDTLSMGMSNDLEIAIDAGTTMVRIGTAIFGSRN
ncbi:hypothetical protein TUM4644_32380 [Shewanella colwelliana]|nr:hypothetical protein TUM4644_32380 [Shewanella colwelliana]